MKKTLILLMASALFAVAEGTNKPLVLKADGKVSLAEPNPKAKLFLPPVDIDIWALPDAPPLDMPPRDFRYYTVTNPPQEIVSRVVTDFDKNQPVRVTKEFEEIITTQLMQEIWQLNGTNWLHRKDQPVELPVLLSRGLKTNVQTAAQPPQR